MYITIKNSLILYKIILLFPQKHLPGYISRAHELKCLGVDEIVCVSVNDPYVMTAWGKQMNAQGKASIKHI